MEILLTVGWSIKCDVYSYGCVLLSLIAKRVVDKKQPSGTYVDTWAKKQYQQKKEKLLVKGILKKVVPKCSLVHKSLEEDPLFHDRDGLIITDLAMSCVEFEPAKRPTMNEVVQKLRALCAPSRGIAKPILALDRAYETM